MTAVEWLIDEHFGGIENCTPDFRVRIEQAKEMEKEQKCYTESDMRNYASYILKNPVIEPSEWVSKKLTK